jgi:hypothetical protein
MLLQTCLMGSVYQSYVYYVPLYFQNARGFSVMMSSLVWIPLVGVQSIVSTSAGLYISRYKRYGEVLWAGFGAWTL